MSTDDLNKLASTPEKIYKLDQAAQLGDIVEDLQSNVCQGKDPCESAGCSHNCQRIENEAVCSCPDDLMLDSDFRNCVPFGSSRGADMCQIQNGGCEHKCVYDAPGYHCECEPGYRLDDNYRNCHDIDECVINNGGCSDKCLNYPGGYFCMCSNWRDEKLGADQKTCEPLCDRGFVYYGHACWRIYGKFDYWDAVDACKALIQNKMYKKQKYEHFISACKTCGKICFQSEKVVGAELASVPDQNVLRSILDHIKKLEDAENEFDAGDKYWVGLFRTASQNMLTPPDDWTW